MKVGGKNENNPFNDNLVFLPSVAINGLIGNERAYSYYILYSWVNIHLITKIKNSGVPKLSG